MLFLLHRDVCLHIQYFNNMGARDLQGLQDMLDIVEFPQQLPTSESNDQHDHLFFN